MKIEHRYTKGEIPRLADSLLPRDAAAKAENIDLESGILQPWSPYKESERLTTSGFIQTIYSYNDTWYAWTTDVDIVRSVINEDQYDRIYYTGDGAPKLMASDIAPDTYLLGMPAPTNEPSLSKSGSSGSDPVQYTYVWAYVSPYGEEGKPCDPVSISSVTDTESVELTNFPSQLTGDRKSSKLRIYRLQDDLASEFFFCKDLEYNSDGNVVDPDTSSTITSWTDDVDASDLGEALISEDWDVPPSDLDGLISHPGGWFAGFVDNTVYMSEPWYPHAWPYSVTVPYQIVGLAISGGTILVLTDEFPQLISGSHPSVVGITEVAKPLPCLSKRSIARTQGGVYFSSPDGMAFGGADPGSWQLVSDQFIDRISWQDFEPDTIHGYIYDKKYFGFYKTGTESGRYLGGGFVFNLDNPEETFTTLGFYAYTGRVNYEDNTIYFVIINDQQQNILIQWEMAKTQSNLTYTWRSREYNIPAGVNLGAAKVIADWPTTVTRESTITYNAELIEDGEALGYVGNLLIGGQVAVAGTNLEPMPDLSGSVIFKLYENGELLFTKTVTSDQAFRLPAGRKLYRFQYQIEAMIPVLSRQLATSVAELYG